MQYAIMLLKGVDQVPCIYNDLSDDEDSAYKKAHELCDNTEHDDFEVYEVSRQAQELECGNYEDDFTYRCPICKCSAIENVVRKYGNYCPNCGTKVSKNKEN